MGQCRIVAQLQILVTRDVVDASDGGEQLRLLHGVNAKIGFQVEIEIQHVLGIPGLLHHQSEDAFLDGFVGGLRGWDGCCFRLCDRLQRAQ